MPVTTDSISKGGSLEAFQALRTKDAMSSRDATTTKGRKEVKARAAGNDRVRVDAGNPVQHLDHTAVQTSTKNASECTAAGPKGKSKSVPGSEALTGGSWFDDSISGRSASDEDLEERGNQPKSELDRGFVISGSKQEVSWLDDPSGDDEDDVSKLREVTSTVVRKSPKFFSNS